MDILSITASTVRHPEVHSRPGPTPRAEASDKAPPGSNATSQTLQKEAARTGQKTPETVLDQLEATLGKDLGLSTDARSILGQVDLPASPEELVAMLSSLGVPVSHLPVASAVPTGPVLDALRASNLPKPVISALGDLVQASSILPMPASQLIDMGRETSPAPAVQLPIAFSTANSTPDPVSSDAPNPASQGFQASTAPARNSGQQFASGQVEDLNLTMISATSQPVVSSTDDLPRPVADPTPRPAVQVPRPTSGPIPQSAPNPTVGIIPTIVKEVPKPVVTTVVPHPTPDLLTKPSPDNLGRPVPTSGDVPASGPVPRTVPNPGATPQPTTVPRPVRDPQAMPAQGIPQSTTVELEPASTAAIKPSSTVPKVDSGSGESTPAIVPNASSVKIMASSGSSEFLDLLDESDSDETPVASSTNKGSVDPKPVEGLPEAFAAPTVKPKADPLPKATSDQVADQVASRIETMAHGKKPSHVTMHLEPRDLGTITLTVKAFGNKVDASVSASHEDVRASLEANRPMLVQNVEGRGLTLNSFDVTQNPQGQAQQADQATHAEFVRSAQLRQAMTTRPVASATPVERPKTSAMDYTV